MNEHDTGVLDTLRDAMDGVTMSTPVEQIVSTGRTRRQHRRLALVAAGTVAVTGLALGVATLANPSAAPPTAGGGVHVRTVAFTVDTMTDGTIQVTWTKRRMQEDPAGLEAALRQAGFPVLMKVGEFCIGPGDDPTLVHGSGPGVDAVVRPLQDTGDDVTFVFDPAAVPAGRQLFIGYLNPAQLEITGGRPGSIERLVPTDVPLTCTTDVPASQDLPGGTTDQRSKSPGVDSGSDPGTKPTAPVDQDATRDPKVTPPGVIDPGGTPGPKTK